MQICRNTLRCGAIIGLLFVTAVESYSSYLFYSSPETNSIHKARILSSVEQSRNEKMTFHKLAGAENIKQPSGIAVDSFRKVMFVVDREDNRGLYAARIYFNHLGTLALEAPVKIVDGLTSDWVAVDSSGKLFFAAFNKLWSLSADAVSDRIDAGSVSTDDLAPKAASEGETTTFEMLYDGGSVKGLNTPQGIAADGYHIFWANGQNGQQDGTVVQGLETPFGSEKTTSLTTNLATAHGVCITPLRVFYTDEEQKVYSTKLTGGTVTTITSELSTPRGCAYDGDSTVYIADDKGNKIVSLAGAGANLGGRRLVHIASVKHPFGLSVYHGDHNAAIRCFSSLAILIAMAVTSCLLI
jgi:hypothetical protein